MKEKIDRWAELKAALAASEVRVSILENHIRAADERLRKAENDAWRMLENGPHGVPSEFGWRQILTALAEARKHTLLFSWLPLLAVGAAALGFFTTRSGGSS